MRPNLSLYIFITLLLFAACKREDDNVFKQSPDERINEVLAKYSTALTSAEYGWKGLVYPDLTGATPFSFYFKFDTTNRVQMYSDWDSTTFSTLQESSYRLKALQQPCLLFDTYNYIHILCDPDAGVNGGYYGGGWLSDFEFILDSLSGDTIKLTGRLHGAKAILVKATSKEAQDYYDRKRNWEFDNMSRFLTYFKKLHTGKGDYDIVVNKFYRQLTLVNSSLKFKTGYYYTPTGIAFDTPFVTEGETITAFEDVKWSADNQLITLKVNGANATINSDKKPYVVDAEACDRWRTAGINADANYAANGIHVDGQEDYYGFSSIPNYAYFFYFPGYGSGYDFCGIMEDTYYGPAFKTKTTASGVTTFTYGGRFYEIPTYSTDAINNIITKFTETTGYYFVQTSDFDTYDMVSVSDAKSWVNWQLMK